MYIYICTYIFCEAGETTCKAPKQCSCARGAVNSLLLRGGLRRADTMLLALLGRTRCMQAAYCSQEPASLFHHGVICIVSPSRMAWTCAWGKALLLSCGILPVSKTSLECRQEALKGWHLCDGSNYTVTCTQVKPKKKSLLTKEVNSKGEQEADHQRTPRPARKSQQFVCTWVGASGAHARIQ